MVDADRSNGGSRQIIDRKICASGNCCKCVRLPNIFQLDSQLFELISQISVSYIHTLIESFYVRIIIPCVSITMHRNCCQIYFLTVLNLTVRQSNIYQSHSLISKYHRR